MSDAKLLSDARLTEMEVSCTDALRWAATMEVRPNAYKEQVGSAELTELVRGYRAHLAARKFVAQAWREGAMRGDVFRILGETLGMHPHGDHASTEAPE